MGEINPDTQLMELYQEIVRVIHKGRLRDDIRASINKSDSEKKRKSIKGLMRSGLTRNNAGEILKCLEEMRANTELDDWANNIFIEPVPVIVPEAPKPEPKAQKTPPPPKPKRKRPPVSNFEFYMFCLNGDVEKVKEAG